MKSLNKKILTLSLLIILFAFGVFQTTFAQSVPLQIPIPDLAESITVCDGILCTGIGQYIVAIVQWLMVAITLLAVVFIMIGGLIWLTAAGSSKKIGEAKKIIMDSLIGLGLALGSVLLLGIINPALVNFEGIGGVENVKKIDFDISEDGGADIMTLNDVSPASTGVSGLSGVGKRSWDHASFSCSNPPPPCCVLDPSMTTLIPTLSNIINPERHSYHKDLIPAIQRLNETAKKIGEQDGKKYTIKINSGYRSFQRQVDFWCGKAGNCKSKYPNTAERKAWCAVPGGSNHGLGIALDVGLLVNGGNPGLYYGSKTQCDSSRQYVAKLAQIFYASDPKWKRYEAEIWHFEYNPKTSGRSTTTSLPAKCGK